MKLQIDPNDFPRFLARGNVKECYVGDKWPDRVLKVSPAGKGRLTPLEIDYFERLERRGITADFLPKYYGWFENERWLGYVPKLGYRNTESPGKFFKMSSARGHLFFDAYVFL